MSAGQFTVELEELLCEIYSESSIRDCASQQI